MIRRGAALRIASIPLSVLLASAGAAAAEAPLNLLRNPGFENGSQGPQAWHLGMEGKGAGSATWDTQRPHSGQRCVRVELQEPGDYWMADQTLPKGSASDTSLVRLCGWYRANTDGVAHPTVYSLGADGEFLGAFEFTLPAADDWTFFDTVFQPRKGADHFRIQLRVQSRPGVVWYDDVKLTQISDSDGFTAYHQLLAQRLETKAKGLKGWWCAVIPTESRLQFRLRDVSQIRIAMMVTGSVDPSPDMFVGLKVVYDTSRGSRELSIPLIRIDERREIADIVSEAKQIDLDALAPKAWRGGVTINLTAHGIGPEARVLAGIEAGRDVRRGLVEAHLSHFHQSPAGEKLPWVGRFIGDAEDDVARLAARNLNRHLRDVLGARGREAAIVVEDGLTKRRPDEWRDDLLSGRLKPQDTVRLLCAAGETESFQCLFIPPVAPQSLTAHMTRLRGPGGRTLPTKACKVHLVEYVPFAGKWWPDPLLEAQPFQPSKWGPPVFWVTVSVPEEQPPGIYRGQLVIEATPGVQAVAKVRVRVAGFSLPKETHLNSSFWLFRAQIRRYFDLNDEPSAEAYERYIDLATSHRLSPIDVLEGPCSPLVTIYREADGSLSYDWTRWDRFLKRAIAGGANTVHAAWTHWMGRFFSNQAPVKAIDRTTGQTITIAPPHNSEEHLRHLGNYIRAAAEHVRSLGFKGFIYVQPYDEPQPARYEEVATTLAGLGKYAPDVPRLMDAVYPPRLPERLRSNIDVWCPLSPGLLNNEFDTEQAGGDTVWWYVCCGPRGQYANFFTNQSVLENRMLFCQTWQHEVTGVLYWGLNYWISWQAPVPEPRFPEGPWRSSTTNEHANYLGDGYFIYPGPAVDQPLSSIRLETLRDGIEDYEYLHLLAELCRDRQVPAEVERLLSVPPEVSASLTDFTRDPQVFRNYRRQLVEWIEKLTAS